jgi:hypothetical protein
VQTIRNHCYHRSALTANLFYVPKVSFCDYRRDMCTAYSPTTRLSRPVRPCSVSCCSSMYPVHRRYLPRSTRSSTILDVNQAVEAVVPCRCICCHLLIATVTLIAASTTPSQSSHVLQYVLHRSLRLQDLVRLALSVSQPAFP